MEAPFSCTGSGMSLQTETIRPWRWCRCTDHASLLLHGPCSLLRLQGADPFEVDRNRSTPVVYATRNDHPECIRAMVAAMDEQLQQRTPR